MSQELQAREYKLLLESRLISRPSLAAANTFWKRRLQPIIAGRLDTRDGGEPRYEQSFDTKSERIIQFRDSPDCLLTRSDYALRERIPSDRASNDGQAREIMLKLRMPDRFVVGATSLPGCGNDARTKLEEDIAPLEIADSGQPSGGVSIARPHSTRSRFALSTTQTIARAPATLADTFALFPTLERNLQRGGWRPSPDEKLQDGPQVREITFTGAKVRLGDGTTGKFTLTLWQFGKAGHDSKIAELSFKCKLVDDIMPGNAARRAFDLFIALQDGLADEVDRRHASKTALVLPPRCARPS